MPPQLEEAHYEANQFVLDFSGTPLNTAQADVEAQKADVKASLSVVAVDGGAVIANAISSVDMIMPTEVRLTFDADVLRDAGVASGDDLKITYNADSAFTAPNTGLLESHNGTDVMSFETGSFKAQLLELQSGMFDNAGAVPQIRIEFTEELEPGLQMADVMSNLGAYQLDGTTEIVGLINTVTQGVTEGDQNSLMVTLDETVFNDNNLADQVIVLKYSDTAAGGVENALSGEFGSALASLRSHYSQTNSIQKLLSLVCQQSAVRRHRRMSCG